MLKSCISQISYSGFTRVPVEKKYVIFEIGKGLFSPKHIKHVEEMFRL